MGDDIPCVSENVQNNECCEMAEVEKPGSEGQTGVPIIGQAYGSADETYNFYKQYGQSIGFGVMKRSSKKGDDGELRWITYACVRAGKNLCTTTNPLQPRPTSKTGCQARMSITLGMSGRFKVTSIELEHNHDLSPTKSRFHKCNRDVTTAAKRRLVVDERAGIRMHKTFNALGVESGGYDNLTFLEKDCRNFRDKQRRLRLLEGDAKAMHSYFLKMQADNSDFFYSMDVDEKSRLKNVFWADARSLAAFKEFGDVVTFDTTYLTNKYDMPFAPFVGVNHHGLSILLGCALISKEDTHTFVWLFKTWLSCMGESPPSVIITDQDRAMKNAIEVVFPNARHRLCLWHIMKKLPEKLKSYNAYENIKCSLQHAVYDSLTKEEFENSWSSFILKYDLGENEWLMSLYDERSHWVPAFVKDIFWAGMSTTQRSESMNAFFDGFVHSKTTLKEFVEQYENALRKKAEIEIAADYRSYHTLIPLISQFEFERQFQVVYTNDKFKEVQGEMARMMECTVVASTEGGALEEYDVKQFMPYGDVVLKVSANKNWDDVKCTCRLFDFRGIVCRHIFTAMIYKNIYCVSAKYILQRWRKDVKRKHSKIRICYDNWADTPEGRRFDKASKLFHEVIDLAIASDESCNDLMAYLSSVKARLEIRDEVCHSTHPSATNKYGSGSVSQSAGVGVTKESATIENPLIVPSKGRPRVRRTKGTVEKQSNKKKQAQKDIGTKRNIWQTKQSQRQNVAIANLATIAHEPPMVFGTQESINVPFGMHDVQGSMLWGTTLRCPTFTNGWTPMSVDEVSELGK